MTDKCETMRSRLSERHAFAEHKRQELAQIDANDAILGVRPVPGGWSAGQAYWTGLADAYSVALTVLDVLSVEAAE